MEEYYRLMLVFLLWWLSLATAEFGFGHGSPNEMCRTAEREALLSFKQGLKDPSGRLSSWVGEDCCRWRGVHCHNTTGHVLRLNLRTQHGSSQLGGNVSESLTQLKQLRYVDLSGNDFEGQVIPRFFGSVTSLKYLNLSMANFGGIVPHQLGNLSSLRYLDIGHNLEMNVGDIKWLTHMPVLQVLDMSRVDLTGNPNWLHVMNMLPSLSELHLSGCSLNETLQLSYANLSSLITLDLSSNNLDSTVLGMLPSLPSLGSLDLSSNHISGMFPTSIRNMTRLQSLNLYDNMLNSTIPEWLYAISSLKVLDLSRNDFQGKISSAITNLSSLEELGLSENRLGGGFPRSFRSLCKLRVLDLFGNQFTGDLLEFFARSTSCVEEELEVLRLANNQLSGQLHDRLGEFKSLVSLDISNNSIYGPIPASMGRLSSLESLDISRNHLLGSISEIHFANLTRLVSFDASFNPLTIRVSSNWTPPFQLDDLAMSSSRLGPQFPLWLQTQKHLRSVDLSSARISDAIPSSFRFSSMSSLSELDLSNNQIHGNIPSLHYALSIDLSSNDFSGPLPQLPFEIQILDLSNNSLTGSLAPVLCKGITSLSSLVLSRNRLVGELPDCWDVLQDLEVLKLDHNNLTGTIPISLGSLSSLRFLHLRNNSLSGELSPSMQKLSHMQVLDLSENEFIGSIPRWMGKSFDALVVLALRSNKLNGTIPRELCSLNSIQILDVAYNDLSQTIPTCLDNFTVMKEKKAAHYGYTSLDEIISLVVKEREYEYNSAVSGITIIDLSCNSLSGEIPAELTNLDALHALNLSSNQLQGKLPSKIGRMKSLECLDISMNHLSGEIPPGIASLNFLSYLNLSYNNLSGRIPSGTQIQGFTSLSFVGNRELYGPPLTNCCTRDHTQLVPTPGMSNEEESEESGWIDMKWFYLSIPLGFVVGFWGVWVPLAVNKAWRLSYFHSLDDLIYKLFGYH